MHTAKLIKADGTITDVAPANGKKFLFSKLDKLIGAAYVDFVRLPKSGNWLVVDDNGILDRRPLNKVATDIWKEEYPIAEYPNNNTEMIVGDVLLVEDYNLIR